MEEKKKVGLAEWKFLIRLWLSSKKATAFLLLFYVLNLVLPFLVSFYRIPMISAIIEDPTDLWPKLYELGKWCLLIAILDTIRPRAYKAAGVFVFIDVLNDFIHRIMNAKVEQIDEMTPAKVNTGINVINSVADVGQMTGHVIYGIGYLAATLTALYKYLDMQTYIIISAYLLVAVVLFYLNRRISKIAEENELLKRARDQELENSINGFGEVRIYNTGKRHTNSMKDKNDKIGAGIMRKMNIIQGMYVTFNILNMGGVILVLVLSVSRRLSGEMSVADLITAVNLIGQLEGPMDTFLQMFDEIMEYMGRIGLLQEVYDWEPPEKKGTINLGSWKEIVFQMVNFHYASTTDNAISNFTMTIHKGEKIGICGPKGCGKSTLGKLLLRFYKPQSGSIQIDGIDIGEFTSGSYTKTFGAVQQENAIFKGTIRENLMYGNPSADEVQMIEACKKAGIYDFICGLEKGFDTDAGLNGRKLSGGQRQCIAIARMLIRNPEVIILDEATSALDNESERMVQNAIDQIGKDKTTITIAHRLTTIKNCDRILVMGKSGVVEEGTHEQLLARKGEYYKLWNQ